MKTDNASSSVTLRESFSPESVGTRKVRADRNAKMRAGTMIFRT